MDRHRTFRGRATAALTLALLAGSIQSAGAGTQHTGTSGSSATRGAATRAATSCLDRSRTFVHTPRGVLRTKYSPPTSDDTTFLAAKTTWKPDLSTYPIGLDSGAKRTCWYDGTVKGSIPADMTWEKAHSYNQPCIRIVSTGRMVVDGIRCDNTDDGFRPRETSVGAQNATMTVRHTFFTRMHDDCLENDDIIGGLLKDNLWQGCNTGISEKPGGSTFHQPAGEKLILDHMLIGLRVSPHEGGRGENSLFKWSDSANKVVIKCSLFKVDRRSLNGASAMAVPGTVDDSACPRQGTRLVWLGSGRYPGTLPRGIRVVTHVGIWNHAVAKWKCDHGYGAASC